MLWISLSLAEFTGCLRGSSHSAHWRQRTVEKAGEVTDILTDSGEFLVFCPMVYGRYQGLKLRRISEELRMTAV